MTTIQGSDIRKVVVACDAGMGSSVMLTSQLQRTLKPYGVTVEHAQVDRVPGDADVVLCHAGLLGRAQGNLPDKVVIGFQMFMGDPAFARLEKAIKEGESLGD